MERTLYRFILAAVSLLFIAAPTTANNRRSVYTAYIKGDMPAWKKVIDQMQTQATNSAAIRLELINYQYGYVAWCLGKEEEEQARRYLKKAEDNLTWFENKTAYQSTYHAYKAAFIGYRIALNKYKAPILGPESVEYAEKAVELDSQNPVAYIEMGNITYYMPEMFGGSKTRALVYYVRAMQLMERYHDVKYDWNYLNLLASIAQGYQAIGKLEKAKTYYQKLLKIEPGFLWVKNHLYPKLLQEIDK